MSNEVVFFQVLRVSVYACVMLVVCRTLILTVLELTRQGPNLKTHEVGLNDAWDSDDSDYGDFDFLPVGASGHRLKIPVL